jgi:hypothetical protein
VKVNRFNRELWKFKQSAVEARRLWHDALLSYIPYQGLHPTFPYMARAIPVGRIHVDVDPYKAVPGFDLTFDPLGLACQVFREHERDHKITITIVDEIDESLVEQKRVHFFTPVRPGWRWTYSETTLLPAMVADWLSVDSISPQLLIPVTQLGYSHPLVSVEQLFRSNFTMSEIAKHVVGNLRLM